MNMISEIHTQFENPSAKTRPQSIVHAFNRLLKHKAQQGPEGSWQHPAGTGELADDLRGGLRNLRDLGFGGVVANVAWTNYLEDEGEWAVFLQGVRACRELGMRLWIYDEDGYPSGAAGGLTLRDHPEFEAQVLVRNVFHADAGDVEIRPPTGWLESVSAVAKYGDLEWDITEHFASDGCLVWTAPGDCTIERYDIRRAFEGTHATANVYAIRRYINVMDPEAVKHFYDLTFQAYIDRLGDDIGAVEAFFTDEPSFMTAYFPAPPEEFGPRRQDQPLDEFDRLPQLPWRADLPEQFRERWHYDLIPELGALFAGDSLGERRVRHDFHQLVSELYADAFYHGIQERLRAHGIPFSGHVLAEESIVQHVASQGSVMGSLKMMEKPGIDMLTAIPSRILDSVHLLTCKYGSSSAHVCGRNDIMCEASDFDEHVHKRRTTAEERRGALAVQSALGITTYTSYFGWAGFEEGDIRRLMDFCGRVHSAVRQGTHVAPVAVLYPIRTAWTHYLPSSEVLSNNSQPEPLKSLDDALLKIARTLLGNQVDFDFIDSRSFMNSRITDGHIGIADEAYELLVITPGAVLCPRDIDAVRRFAESGGEIVAFTPLSDMRLPDVADSRLSEDEGTSPEELLSDLASKYPHAVKVLDLRADWMGFVRQRVERDLIITRATEYTIVRQSRLEDGDAYLIVNASDDAVSLGVGAAGDVLNPWDGTTAPVDDRSGIEIERYGARIITIPL